MRDPARWMIGLSVGLVLIGASAAAVAVVWWNAQLDTPTTRARERGGILRVRQGSPLSVIATTLSDSGWVEHPRFFSWWGLLWGIDRRVQAGRYRLQRGWTPRRILEEIRRGRVETTRVTIPEGWREEQILPVLADSLEIPRDDLAAAASDAAWMRSIGVEGESLEGYLFPETYTFPKEYTARAALETMVREGEGRFDAQMRARARKIGMSRLEVITLASIVQAEAACEEEMPRIAGVFHNRLRKGWKLEADPTVLYALGRPPGPVLYRDLEVDSPFNTYVVAGLPPGAIGNPGSAALRAALWPDTTRQEFFFVAKGNGEHLFSKTLTEHERARREVRRAMRKQK